MKIAALVVSLIALAACASSTDRAISAELVDASTQAEKFVIRHGYTALGHPSDQPVQRVSLYDGLFGEEDTLKSRQGQMERHAVCVRSLAAGEHVVLFESTRSPGEYWFVSLKPGSNGWVGHQTLHSLPKDCVQVPRAES